MDIYIKTSQFINEPLDFSCVTDSHINLRLAVPDVFYARPKQIPAGISCLRASMLWLSVVLSLYGEYPVVA